MKPTMLVQPLLILLVCVDLSFAQTSSQPIASQNQLARVTATPHAQSIPAINDCKAAAEYSHSQRGTGVLVMVRGEIVFEDYAPGWTADKPHLLASGTKSFCGVMATCAVHDGLLTLDEKVAETLTEWKDDQRKSQITIRQLLSLSSGIEGGDNGSVPSYKRAVSMANATADAGKKFSYGPIPFQCFGELMRRKLEPKGESVEAYLHRRVLDPIGMKVGLWRKDADGNINLPADGSTKETEACQRTVKIRPSLYQQDHELHQVFW